MDNVESRRPEEQAIRAGGDSKAVPAGQQDAIMHFLVTARHQLAWAEYQQAAFHAEQVLAIVHDNAEAREIRQIAEACARHLGPRGERLRQAISVQNWYFAERLVAAVAWDLGRLAAMIPSLESVASLIAAKSNSLRRQAKNAMRTQGTIAILLAVLFVIFAVGLTYFSSR